MKEYPTNNADIDAIWDDDLLKRSQDAGLLIDFITARMKEHTQLGQPSSYVINVDAGWGQGKTFFLKRLHRQLGANGCLVAYINAWEDDHAEDPLIAIMAGVETGFRKKLKSEKTKKALAKVKTMAGRLAVTVGKHTMLRLGEKALGASGVDAIGKDVNSIIEKSYEDVVNELYVVKTSRTPDISI